MTTRDFDSAGYLAATDQAEAMVANFVRDGGGTALKWAHGDSTGPASRLLDLWLDEGGVLLDPECLRRGHLRTAGVLGGLLAAPRLVHCVPCWSKRMERRRTDYSEHCDGCARLVDSERDLHELALQGGPAVAWGRLCVQCRRELGVE